MQNTKTAIAKNITALRKAANMTQYELAQKLNYSDKSVSKWERAESAPDIFVLKQMADMFGVSVDFMLQETHGEHEGAAEQELKRRGMNRLIIALLSAALVWLIATVIFVMLEIIPQTSEMLWLTFVYAVPVSCIVLLVFNAMWGKRVLTFVIVSLLVWSLLFSLYFTFLKHNIAMIFIIGIPAQVIIVLWANLKTNPLDKLRRKEKKQ